LAIYHLELRHFPHSACRFNLSEQELRAVLEPWAAERIVEFGERKWSPHQAKLTIIEGPQLEIEQLSMGRGWRTAQREGRDVTGRLLAQAGEAVADASTQAAAQGPPSDGGALADPLADPLVLGVLADLRSVASLLGADPAGLLAAWRAVAARQPGLAPSETLALAERDIATGGGSPG
jgi:hypothetical protein